MAIGAALAAPVPAFARGGGHGGGGHCGGGHGGGGHGNGAHGGGAHGGGPRGGGTRDGHGSGQSHRSNTETSSGGYGRGRIYPWIPPPLPPVVADGSQGMQCQGIYVAPGDTQDNVFRACGQPTTTRQVVYTTRDAEQVVDVWSYELPNTAKRTLRFQNGILTSIDSVGPLTR